MFYFEMPPCLGILRDFATVLLPRRVLFVQQLEATCFRLPTPWPRPMEITTKTIIVTARAYGTPAVCQALP